MENFNKVFRTADNVIFTRISAKEAETFVGNYITVIDGKAIAVVDGKEVEMPKSLFNEIGVQYFFVDYKEHGKKMLRKHGVYAAVKTEKIRVWRNVKPGEKLATVIDGYVERHKE